MGHQRKVTGEIEKIEGNISVKELYMNHIYDEIPSKIMNYINPGDYKNWSDEYMKDKHEGVIVEATQKVPGGHGTTKPKHMRMEKFLRRYKSDDINLIMTLPYTLEKIALLPEFLKCGPIMPHIEEAKLWWSYGMTSSHIHADHE